MTLRADRITFAYRRGTTVLRDCSAEFPAGAVTAIIGPNGAGKTTLLRALLGLIEPQQGSADHAGAPVLSLRARVRAARLAYAPQRPSIVGAFTTRRVVALGRLALPSRPDLIDRALADADLSSKAEHPFTTLSAGQQQRAALARALAQLDAWTEAPHPRALLADEPVASLDPAHALAAMGLLRAAAARNIAVILATHDLIAARRFADRAVALNAQGAVAAQGLAADVLSPPTLARLFNVPFDEAATPHGAAPVPFAPTLPRR